MVERSIINYIEDSLSRGLTLDQIKKNLQSAGWTNNDINEAIRTVNSQQKNTSTSGYSGYSQEGPSEGGMSKKVFILIGILFFIAVVFAVWFFVFKDKGTDQLKTCSELEGYVCSASETCGGTTLPASDTYDCCSRACTTICVENWNCSNFTACVNNSQSRVCVDSNACGTTNSKPFLTQSCGTTNNNCSAGNGCNLNCANVGGGDPDCSCAAQDNFSIKNITLCRSAESCNGSVIDSNDSASAGVCCVGNCIIDTCLGGNICNLSCAANLGDPDCSCGAQNNTLIRNLTLCAGWNYGCNGTKMFSNNSETCCAGRCITPVCGHDGLCALNCPTGDVDCHCTAQTNVSRRNMTLCDGPTYGCTGTKITSNDTAVCCTGDCITPTCDEYDGLCSLDCASEHGDLNCACTQEGGAICHGTSMENACVGGEVNFVKSLEYNVSTSTYCCLRGCNFYNDDNPPVQS
jgi:hypothetical protein